VSEWLGSRDILLGHQDFPVATNPMKIIQTEIPEVFVLEPRTFADARGYFFEAYNERGFAAAGIPDRFVQDNQSNSKKNVLRGLHFQVEQVQGKLVRVINGEIFDVAVDLRKGSPTLGKWVGLRLSAASHQMIWIPKGFAHGFYTMSDTADVHYKVTDFYAPQSERTLLWNDPEIGIDWPLNGDPILSEKDRAGIGFREALKTGSAR
jgi:dTDP-4-dehydrorhamnose 3,5-epimerase